MAQAARPLGVIDQREAYGAAITSPRDSNCPIARRADQPVI
ncbi:hypothetical protein ACFYUD_24040 [Nocardia tengchongensis]